MTQKKFSDLLVWVDIETTGVTDSDIILEIALVLTDNNLEIVDVYHSLVSEIDPSRLIPSNAKAERGSDFPCWPEHFKTQLIESLICEYNSGLDISLTNADDSIKNMLKSYGIREDSELKPPLCGSSVHFDRRFMQRDMPKTMKSIHYRNVDVSGIVECVRRFNPNVEIPDAKDSAPSDQSKSVAHRALSDILGSINTLKYLRSIGIFTTV